MLYFTIVFFCMAGLFLFLLESRFRLWTTVGVTAGVYVLSLLGAFALRRMTDDPVLCQQLPCAAGALLFFLSSLFLYVNNWLQKLFLALLSLCNFTFLSFFIPLFLGVLPVKAAGGGAGVLSVLLYLLFSLLMGLCLYRPFHHFSDRGPSGFLTGMGVGLVFLQILCLGKLDFLFRTNIPAARLLLAVLFYCAMIFMFRSLYQAGRFREKAADSAAQSRLLAMRAQDYDDLSAAVREVRATEKAGEYALDTVSVMLADGWTDKIPQYVNIAKENTSKSPVLIQYHPDPHLNAVIAAKAAFAHQNDISFSCNAVTEGAPIGMDDLCVIVGELLTRACRDAAAYEGKRKVRFTSFPTETSLQLEAVYSFAQPARERFTLKGKRTKELLEWIFDESPKEEDDLHGLANTVDIIHRASGKLTYSSTGRGEAILQAALRF